MALKNKQFSDIISISRASAGSVIRPYALGNELALPTNIITGWQTNNSTVAANSVTGELTVTATVATNPFAYHSFATVPGKIYQGSIQLLRGTTPNNNQVRVATTYSGTDLFLNTSVQGSGIVDFSFKATTTTSYIAFGFGETAIGQTSIWSNLSIREVILDSAYGPEVITNGTFDTNTTGWTSYSSTIARINDELEITATSNNAQAVQPVGLVVGRKYEFSADVRCGTTSQITIMRTTPNGFATIGTSTATSKTNIKSTFFADRSTTDIILIISGSTGQTGYFDNVSLKEVATESLLMLPINEKRTDYTWESDLGSNLVANSDFSSGTSGWTGSNATLSTVSGELGITSTVASGVCCGSTPITTVIGKKYKATATIRRGSTAANVALIAADNAQLNTGLNNVQCQTQAPTKVEMFFVATTTTTYIGVRNTSVGGIGETCWADNISVKECLATGKFKNLGILIEDTATNSTTTSDGNHATGGVWTSDSLFSYTTSSSNSPTGRPAFRISRPAGSIAGTIVIPPMIGSMTAGNMYCPSIFIKIRNPSMTYLEVYAGVASSQYGKGFTLKINNGICTSTDGSTIQYLTNGWHRIGFPFTAGGTGTLATSGLVISGGTGGYLDIELAGLQWESGNAMTSYIPTPFTFTGRSSIASYIDSDGYMKYAPVNVPRYEYNPADLSVVRSLKREAGSSNLILEPEDLSTSAWFKRGTTVAQAEAEVAPDGTRTMSLITRLGQWPTNDIYCNSTPFNVAWAGERFNTTFYIKKVSTTGTIRVNNTESQSYGEWRVNLALLGTGIERITPTHPAVTVIAPFVIAPTGGAGLHFCNLDATELSFYVWGCQQERGAIYTSYVPNSFTFTSRSSTATSWRPNRRGPELITNGDFSSGSTGWTLGLWTVSGGSASLASGTSMIYQTTGTLTVGKLYRAEWDSSNASTINAVFGNTYVSVNQIVGRNVAVGYCTSSTQFGLQGGSVYSGIDNISVKEVILDTITDLIGPVLIPANSANYKWNPALPNIQPKLIKEIQKTNYLQNSEGQNYGAGNTTNGITKTLVGTGTIGDFKYSDIRISGTATATYIDISTGYRDGGSPVGGACVSVYTSIIANAMTLPTYRALRFIDYAAGWTNYENSPDINISGTVSNTLTRYTTAKGPRADRTVINAVISFSATPGQAYDFTIRIAMPQIEEGISATSYIPTFGTQATRAADIGTTAAGVRSVDGLSSATVTRYSDLVSVNKLNPWVNYNEYTIVFKGDCRTQSNRWPGFWNLTATGGADRTMGYVGVDNVAGAVVGARSDVNSVQTNVNAWAGVYNTVPFTAAISFSKTANAICLNGSTVNGVINTTLPASANSLKLGLADNYLNGHISSIKYYPVKFSDAQLIAASSI